MFSGFCFSTLLHLVVSQAGNAPAVTEQAWYMRFVPLLVVVLLLAGCFYLGKLLAGAWRMPDYATRIGVILTALACSVLVISTKWPPRFGVDLSGGINMIGQLDLGVWGDQEAASLAGQTQIRAKDIIPTLRDRVDPSGTKEIVIRALGDDKIEVIMPRVELAEAMDIWNRLAQTGHLQFRILADSLFHNGEMTIATEQANQGIRSARIVKKNSDGSETVVARWYDLARVAADGPPDPNRPLVRDRETGRLIPMAQVPLGNFDPGAQFAAWLAANNIRNPQILMIEPPNEKTDVEGEHLKDVQSTFDQMGRPCITFGMTATGAKRMGALTKRHEPTPTGKYRLGIVLDDALHSAPEIESAIYGRGEIRGSFTIEEVNNLKINLDSGKISVALVKDPISTQYLESTLGSELKTKGLWTIGISLLAVILFMLFYYRAFAGGVTCLALLLNLLMTLAFVMAIDQPLTLTGLAGIVLTIGMAVDANVLIFERIREELARGASLRMAIQNGFDRALGTIVDSNLTTLLTAIVLYVLGTDQIKGFSVTLIVGLLTSMFTAVYVSRTFFNIAERKKWLTSLSFFELVKVRDWDFMSKFWPAAISSIVIITVGMACLFTLGSRVLDIDLRGGSMAQVVFNDAISRTELEKALRNQNYQHNGEPVDFVVSTVNDDKYPGRVYKIDSSIPSYDATSGLEPWEELNELLAKWFAGKLRLHQVTVPETISVEPVGTAAPQSSALPPAAEKAPRVASRDWAEIGGGLLTVQDAAPGETVPAAGTQSGEQPAAGAQDPGEIAPTAQDPAAGQAPLTQENPTTPPAGQAPGTTETPADPKPEAQDQAAGQQFLASMTLDFADPISARSLRTQLVEAASRIDRPIEESRIVLTGEGIPAGEVTDALQLNRWNVAMETSSRDDANEIVLAWSTNFNQLPYFKTASGVGGQIAASTQWKAFAAILASLLGIIAYVWVRFQNIAFGIAAVVALIHDVLVVLAAIAISHYVAGALGFLMVEKFKISLQIIAALLTVIGFSINDTIVIFDRVREVRGKRLEMTNEIINKSVSQTLGRTILTSLTVLIVVMLLYFFGGPAIHGFAFSMVIGVIAGTYSTVFVASPILVWLMNRFGLNAELNAELDAAKT
jgi:SecD/SecF fusion protein